MMKQIPLFPQSKFVRGQVYYDYGLSLGNGTGAVTSYFYSCNSMYDPDTTGTGHQPMGFDQMMVFYNHYCVTAAHAKVTFYGNSSTASRVAISLSPDSTNISDPIQVVENGLIKLGVVDKTADSADKKATLQMNCDLASYFGKRKQRDLLDDEKMTGDVSNSPADQTYFAVSGWSLTGGSDLMVYFDIAITYDCIYYEPRKSTTSWNNPRVSNTAPPTTGSVVDDAILLHSGNSGPQHELKQSPAPPLGWFGSRN
jgi:hypothetical protein